MISPILRSGFVLLCFLLLLGRVGAAESGVQPASPLASSANQYVGSASCRSCHEKFYGLWSTSHHGLAMQPYTEELARKKLSAQKEPVAIGAYRFKADPLKGLVTESGPGGEKSYKIEHTLGGKNVFYFLTQLERGRLQVLPVAYDVNRKEWYDTAGSAMRHFGGQNQDASYFWKDAPYTFNTSCYNCHVSQLNKNYDFKTDSYQTTWGEPGINCETCHGPAGDHVKAAQKLKLGEEMKDVKLIVTRTMTAAQTNATCGSCHVKLTPLTQSFPPGEKFEDHFAMTTLEDHDFYPDGRDLGENFTMTTWGLSSCAQRSKLDCVDCHTSSGRYKFREGNPNAACLPCHDAKVKNVTEHSHHAAGSEGAKCISCHMPMTEFGRMRRSDHSMRAPTPATTLAYNSPNACNSCHKDRDAAWADQQVRTWHKKDYQAPLLKRAALIAAARRADWTKVPEMVQYLMSPEREEIWATSLLRMLRTCDDPAKVPALLDCMKDKSALVRAAAIESFGERVEFDQVPALLAATRDEIRLVRVRAAAVLANLPRETLSGEERSALEAANTEYLAALNARPDDSTSRYNLGNYYLERRDFARAVEEYNASSKFLPQNILPLANRAIAYASLGQNDKAEESLRQALVLEPNNPAINLNLGMLLAEIGKLDEAEKSFRAALKNDPRSAPAAFNLGVLLAKTRPDESLKFCRLAVELRPQDPNYEYTLAYFLNQQGKTKEAIEVLEAALSRSPAMGDLYAMLGTLYEMERRLDDAARVYNAGIANNRLALQERAQFQALLQRMRRR